MIFSCQVLDTFHFLLSDVKIEIFKGPLTQEPGNFYIFFVPNPFQLCLSSFLGSYTQYVEGNPTRRVFYDLFMADLIGQHSAGVWFFASGPKFQCFFKRVENSTVIQMTFQQKSGSLQFRLSRRLAELPFEKPFHSNFMNHKSCIKGERIAFLNPV